MGPISIKPSKTSSLPKKSINSSSGVSLEELLHDVRACRACEKHLPLGPNPVVQVDPRSKVLIISQAPGTKVHETSTVFNDPSGDRLRKWMGVTREEFYNPENISVMPMGFCYPGKGNSGDLPPRKDPSFAPQPDLACKEFLVRTRRCSRTGKDCPENFLNK